MWFRSDLRLHDNPALVEAIAEGADGVLPLFVVDDTLWGESARSAYLRLLLTDLSARIGGLHVVHGEPTVEVPRVAEQVGAESVHVAAAYTPYGSRRDHRVEHALAEHGVRLERTGSPYAVAPGRITKDDGTSY